MERCLLPAVLVDRDPAHRDRYGCVISVLAPSPSRDMNADMFPHYNLNQYIPHFFF